MAKKRPRRGARAVAGQAGKQATRPVASIFPNDPALHLPIEFATAVKDLERALGCPVVLLIQGGSFGIEIDSIDQELTRAFYSRRGHDIQRGEKIALLIDSFGGQAKGAFEIASLFKKYCGGFTAVIPRRAKSAATLLALGAEEILMAEFSELGPLDAQLFDPERQESLSVLDETQSLERLNAYAMSAIDEFMLLLLNRTGMKPRTLLPDIRGLVADMMRPLLESVDVVRYTQMSRILKVAEEYARRLLAPKFTRSQADEIARTLSEKYPEHSFIIYREEADEIGLPIRIPNDVEAEILSRIIEQLPGLTAIGRIEEGQVP